MKRVGGAVVRAAGRRGGEGGFRGTRLAACAAIAVAPMAAPVEAAEAAPGEIVVTAQRRTENLQQVPLAITAVGAEQLEARNIASAAELSRIAPNVQLDAAAPIFASSQLLVGYIRGIGQNDVSSSFEPGVGIYVDGVILARSIGANVDLLDVERVEILRGPQGTLFGRNAVGGAISVVTRDPGDRLSLRGDVTTGSRARFDARLSADLPIAPGLSSQLSVSRRSQRGYQKILAFSDPAPVSDEYAFGMFPRNDSTRHGGTDSIAARAKLLWEPGDRIRIRLAADYARADENAAPVTLVATDTDPSAAVPTYPALYNICIGTPAAAFAPGGALAFLGPICGPRGGGTPGAPPLPGLGGNNASSAPPRLFYGDQFLTDDIDTSYGNGANRSFVRSWGVSAHVEYRLADEIRLTSITGYRRVKADLASDIDGSPLMIATTASRLAEEQFSQELQLNFEAFDARLQSVAGLYFFEERNENLEAAYFAEGLAQFYSPARNRNKSVAAYSHNSFALSDRLGLTIGARYTRDRKRFSADQADLNLSLLKLGLFTPDQLPDPDDPTRIYPIGVLRDTYENVSLRLGAEYRAGEDAMLYASFAQGFKSGGYTTRLSTPTPGNIPPRFSPEKADTYEIGAKFSLIDRRLTVNAAAFHTRYRNLQTIVIRGISLFIQNAGEAEIDGFEIEWSLRPASGVRLTGGLGYLDARYTRLDADVSFTTDDAFVNTPKWSAFAAADIDLFDVGGGKLGFESDFSYKSRIARDAVNTPALVSPSQAIVNMGLRWSHARTGLEVRAGVRNLGNERYILAGTEVGPLGATTVSWSRPREYQVSLGYRY